MKSIVWYVAQTKIYAVAKGVFKDYILPVSSIQNIRITSLAWRARIYLFSKYLLRPLFSISVHSTPAVISLTQEFTKWASGFVDND